jgi:hypothetical protein
MQSRLDDVGRLGEQAAIGGLVAGRISDVAAFAYL